MSTWHRHPTAENFKSVAKTTAKEIAHMPSLIDPIASRQQGYRVVMTEVVIHS